MLWNDLSVCNTRNKTDDSWNKIHSTLKYYEYSGTFQIFIGQYLSPVTCHWQVSVSSDMSLASICLRRHVTGQNMFLGTCHWLSSRLQGMPFMRNWGSKLTHRYWILCGFSKFQCIIICITWTKLITSAELKTINKQWKWSPVFIIISKEQSFCLPWKPKAHYCVPYTSMPHVSKGFPLLKCHNCLMSICLVSSH